MRLIDADAVLKAVNDFPFGYRGMIRNVVYNAPTIDAIAVVRCKECRWGKEACGNIECFADTNVPPEYHGYEWFCPNGERGEADE